MYIHYVLYHYSEFKTHSFTMKHNFLKLLNTFFIIFCIIVVSLKLTVLL